MGKWQKNGIGQKEDGTWFCRMTYTDSSGKRKNVERACKNKTHAKETLNALRQKYGQLGDTFAVAERIKFSELAEEFQKNKLQAAKIVDGKKVSGVKNPLPYRTYMTVLIQHFGFRLVKSITHADIEAFKNMRFDVPTKDGTQRKISSVNRELETLRSIFSFAERKGYVLLSPFKRGETLISKSLENRRERILSDDEEARLLAALTGRRSRIRPVIVTALDTGMRRGELLKLTWDDVDLENGFLTIRATNSKTNRMRRVPMSERVQEEIQRVREADPQAGPDDLVFGIRDNFQHAWDAALTEAGIQGLKFHDLRHTAITRLVNQGIPAEIIKLISGHTQDTTFRRYVNPSDEMLKNAIRGKKLLEK